MSNFQLDIKKNGICVGKTYEKINIRIIPIPENNISEVNKQELEALALGINRIGEIIVSGHHVLSEYYNSTEAFKKTRL